MIAESMEYGVDYGVVLEVAQALLEAGFGRVGWHGRQGGLLAQCKLPVSEAST